MLLLARNLHDLSLNGNPNPHQNFDLVLNSPHLKCLSLKFCSLNQKSVAKIAEKLSYPNETSLVSLTLSSNSLDDDCAKSLANMLRTNRTLVYLNLADNFVTDEGCKAIVEVLRVFPLKHEEIVLRRRKMLEILKRKRELLQEYLMKNQSDISRPRSESTLRKRGSSESRKSHRKSADIKSSDKKSSRGSLPPKENSSASNKSKDKISAKEMSKINKSLECLIELDGYPFLVNCYPEDKQMFCRGNMRLLALNLACTFHISRLNVQITRL